MVPVCPDDGGNDGENRDVGGDGSGKRGNNCDESRCSEWVSCSCGSLKSRCGDDDCECRACPSGCGFETHRCK